MSLVKRHSLITFFFLTYALTWILWLPLVFLRDTIPAAPALVLVLLGSLIPSTLAIVLTAIVFGRRSLVALLTVMITLVFFIFPGSALGEEIGWRGYALPRLQYRRSALSASLILGVIWAFYHLPLFFTGQAFRSPSLLVPFVVSGLALSVILTWVYNSTGGSLLLVVLLHATANLPLTLLLEPLGSRAMVPFMFYV